MKTHNPVAKDLHAFYRPCTMKDKKEQKLRPKKVNVKEEIRCR